MQLPQADRAYYQQQFTYQRLWIHAINKPPGAGSPLNSRGVPDTDAGIRRTACPQPYTRCGHYINMHQLLDQQLKEKLTTKSLLKTKVCCMAA